MLTRLILTLMLVASPAVAREKTSVVVQQGQASIYADRFHGQETASGARHDQNDLTAASRVLPLGTRATVTNVETGKYVHVEITDRGPYAGGRIIDLSRKAATEIGLTRREGLARVRVEADARRQPTAALKEKIAQLAAARAAPPRPKPARSEMRRAVRER